MIVEGLIVVGHTSLKIAHTVEARVRGCFPKFANGLNIKIGIVQKVYEWQSCSFAKMIFSIGDHFDKKTAWSHVYFMNYVYFDM